MQVVVVNSCYRLRVFSGMNEKFTNRTKCDLWKFRRRKIQYQNEKCLQTVTDQFNMKQYDENSKTKNKNEKEMPRSETLLRLCTAWSELTADKLF